MSDLPDLSKKDVSTSEYHSRSLLTCRYLLATEALLEESRSPGDSIKGSFSDLSTEATSGARYDKNKLPDQLAWDKTRTEKVQVMENTPSKMYAFFVAFGSMLIRSVGLTS